MRYRSPLSTYDRLVHKLQERIEEINDGKMETRNDAAGDLSYPVPSRWQAIIKCLWQSGAIREPKMYFEPLFNDEPKIYSLRLWAASIEGKTDGGTEITGGGFSRGASLELEEALSKVIGEFLERYPLLLYRDSELLRASVQQLRTKRRHFADPFLLAGPSEEQRHKLPNRQFDEQSIFQWARGRSLSKNCEALIPAQLIFWNYRLVPDEPFLQQPITNGAGGYFSHEGAILSGLYELIQRDAFFTFWFNKLAPPRVAPSSLQNPASRKIVRDAGRYRIRVEILDITSDLDIPAFVVALLDTSSEGPAVSVGGGCGPDPEAAILRALTEAMGIRHWLRVHGRYPTLPEPYEPFSTPLGQLGRVSLWGHPSMREKFNFFLQGPLVHLASRSFTNVPADPAQELSRLNALFTNRGSQYEVFYYPAVHPLLQTLSYHSIRVVVPALLPLYLNETCAPQAPPRIREACRAMGYTPAETINTLPHPFP